MDIDFEQRYTFPVSWCHFPEILQETNAIVFPGDMLRLLRLSLGQDIYLVFPGGDGLLFRVKGLLDVLPGSMENEMIQIDPQYRKNIQAHGDITVKIKKNPAHYRFKSSQGYIICENKENCLKFEQLFADGLPVNCNMVYRHAEFGRYVFAVPEKAVTAMIPKVKHTWYSQHFKQWRKDIEQHVLLSKKYTVLRDDLEQICNNLRIVDYAMSTGFENLKSVKNNLELLRCKTNVFIWLDKKAQIDRIVHKIRSNSSIIRKKFNIIQQQIQTATPVLPAEEDHYLKIQLFCRDVEDEISKPREKPPEFDMPPEPIKSSDLYVDILELENRSKELERQNRYIKTDTEKFDSTKTNLDNLLQAGESFRFEIFSDFKKYTERLENQLSDLHKVIDTIPFLSQFYKDRIADTFKTLKKIQTIDKIQGIKNDLGKNLISLNQAVRQKSIKKGPGPI
ncbi:hypothetical protein JW935_10090 [candidate division KSB1 bacterium]|nr:hypothetical protein [candidate division KSB1 bacterium]